MPNPDLKVRKEIFVQDKDEFKPEKWERVKVATPTEGPHRYTIYVPHDENARISVGAAHPIMGEPGIALETKSHIHFWTHDVDLCGVGTYLHLGQRSVNTGYEVNLATDGYAMFTSGASSHIATGEVTLQSQTGSTMISALTHNQISSLSGEILMTAKEGITGKTPGCIELSAGKTAEEIEEEEHLFTAGLSGADKMMGMGLVAFEAFEFLAPLGKLTGGKALKLVEHRDWISEKQGKAAEHVGELVEHNIATSGKLANFYTGAVETNAAKYKEIIIAKARKNISNVLKHATAVTGLVLGFKKELKKTQKHKVGWDEKGTAYYGMAVDAAMSLDSALRDFVGDPYKELISHVLGQEKEGHELDESATEEMKAKAEADAAKKKDEGKIKLDATEGISLNTEKSVSLYAGENVSLAGFMSNTITGMGCTIKAYNNASVWGGMGAALKALVGDVAMTTDFGEANVKGNAGVEVSSGEGDVKVTGEKTVQLNSVKEKLMAHGHKGFYLGVGKCDGQGLIATKTKLEIGCINDAEDFEKVKLDKDHGSVTITKIMAAIGNGPDNRLDIKKAGVQLKGAKLDVKTSGPIKINGATVNIN